MDCKKFVDTAAWARGVALVSVQGRNLRYGICGPTKAAGMEVMPSIGGWAFSDYFPRTVQVRCCEAGVCHELCERLSGEYGFDGVDTGMLVRCVFPTFYIVITRSFSHLYTSHSSSRS